MSNPQNNFQREHAKPTSSNAALGSFSVAAPRRQRPSAYQSNPAYNQAELDYTATTAPPTYLNNPRPHPHVRSGALEGFYPYPSQYNEQTHDFNQVHLPASGAVDTSTYRSLHPNITRPQTRLNSGFDTAPLTQTAQWQQPPSDRRPAFHESPPPYRAHQATPDVRSLEDIHSEVLRFRAERVRRGALGRSAYGQPYQQEQNHQLVHNVPHHEYGQQVEEGSVPVYPTYYESLGAQNGVYQDSSQFAQLPTGQFPTLSSAFASGVDRNFDQPVFQDPAYISNTGFELPANSNSGFGMPTGGLHVVGNVPGSLLSAVDPGSAMHHLANGGYMQNVERAWEAVEQYGPANPQQEGDIFSNTPAPQYGSFTGTGDRHDMTAAQARVQELVEQRTRQVQVSMEQRSRHMQYARWRARRPVDLRPPPPAHVQHFTTLPAADSSHDADCPICHDPYDDGEHTAIQLQNVACTHVFGHCCLQEWVNSGMQNAHKCPSCRQSLAGALAVPQNRPPRNPYAAPTGPADESTASVSMLPGPRQRRQAVLEDMARATWEAREYRARQESDQRDFVAPLQTHVPTTVRRGGAVAEPSAPSNPPERTTPNDYRQLAQDLINRTMARNQQQLARFDAEAAARTANAQATGLQEASALVARIAEERTAIVQRQQEQTAYMRERVVREVQGFARSRAGRQI
ncbi:hypothetical protein CC86DRAFT_377645 [Ophiobolus disseminans]|uniref:RING-type domain-containing protein n=1 Tax=Ophiobolus disseminans TaxID=1469910 RepID=A0A6A7AH59_9PLEO|nr:hypothetical protein CC86DRAFT_377645 [Ophiobolus disseminans]